VVGEPSVKLKTERGDYRGFYADVRDAIEKKACLEVTPKQALGTMRAVMLAHIRVAGRGGRWSGERGVGSGEWGVGSGERGEEVRQKPG
jgi:hypothetical protein